MSTTELVQSKKGGQFLRINGYLYYKDSAPKNVYLRCRYMEECPARVTTRPVVDPSNIIIVRSRNENNHYHAPHREAVEAVQIVGGIKRAAEERPDMPGASLLRQKLRKVPSGYLCLK